MPGFAATPVEKDAKTSGICCPHCELLLKEPMQTEEGSRLCKDCFHQISK
jgi:formylmethanofuran dehydrogenase subunit E